MTKHKLMCPTQFDWRNDRFSYVYQMSNHTPYNYARYVTRDDRMCHMLNSTAPSNSDAMVIDDDVRNNKRKYDNDDVIQSAKRQRTY